MSRPVDNSSAEAARRAAEAAARAAAEAARRAAEAAARQQQQAAKSASQNQARPQAFTNDQFSAQAARPQVNLNGAPAPTNAAQTRAADGTPGTEGTSQAQGNSPLPPTPEELPKLFPELKDKSKEDLQKAYDALTKLATGSFSEKATALGELSKQFPETVPNALERLGLKDSKLAKLATNSDALGALGTLSDPAASTVDKAKAALTLAKSAGDIFKPEDLKGVLNTALNGLPAAEKLINAVATWSDPSKTGLDKAKATLELAGALKEFAGADSAKLANDLRKLDGTLRAAGAALTLLDPSASMQDKALAAAQLAAEIPDLQKDIKAFADLLKSGGLSQKQATELAQQGANLANVAVKGLDPALAAKLTPAQLQKLNDVATKLGGPDKLESVLKGITDPKVLDGLVGQLDTLDPAAGKRLVSALGGLEHGVLAKALSDPKMAEQLGTLATKLDDEAAAVVAKAIKEFDSEALGFLLKLSDGAGADALNTSLKGLGPLLEKGGSKLLAQGLKALDGMLGKLGVEMGKEVAEKVFKNLSKAIPFLGAVPGVIDAAKYANESVQLQSKNKDLGYFALVGAQLNGADAVVGTLLDFTGVGAAVNAGVGLGFGVAELAFDIAFEAEKKKFEADPQGYQAPDWMKAINVATAAAQGPQGLATLAAYYGPEEAAKLVEWGVEKGAKGAVQLAEWAGVSAAEATGDGLKTAAGIVRQLADVIRNPSKYGDAVAKKALETYNAVIEKGGQLADEAKKVLADVVDKAKQAGLKGLETLKWIAQNPGPAAKQALDGIKSLIDSGVDFAKETGKELFKKAVSTLNELQAGYEKLTGAAKEKAKELLDSARAGLSSAIDSAKRAGEKGLELLTWAAKNPGQVADLAKKALTDILAQGGELAKKAWDGIRGLGEQGKAIAESVIKGLKDAGAKGVETLRYIAENPGAAAREVREWVGQTLSDLARKTGDAAKAAATAIKDFVDRRADWAKKFAVDLLKDGVASFKEVAQAWKDNLTEGGKELLSALKDLGDAGVDALKDLASYGGQLAGEAVSHLNNLAQQGISAAKSALEGLQALGGEVGRIAGNALDAIADTATDIASGEVSVGGVTIDFNPFYDK
ncbi:Dauer Up-regulated [Myxococcus sp. RHSTA-1-4]|uniref:Dauer Up-regulated n=1 Tax=Myxococcus sp. RHSTA-1-4 TaxID=2874601 RepID=UPI001CBC6180|nr:Dauer Up-regulated [Myxococcus sp. RHSTA-1-4]MBZ4415833.1 Dauer Up-regulated [Myxococcus sp. RHSTA-1-4]